MTTYPWSRRISTAIAAALLLLQGTASSSFAQSSQPLGSPGPSSTPRIVAHTSLVLIPAVVTDRNGAHITGLTKDDFYVLENKQRQKISIFEENRR